MAKKAEVKKPKGEPLPDRMQRLMERTQKIWANSLDRTLKQKAPMKADPLNTTPSVMALTADLMSKPQKLMEANFNFWASQAELWQRFMTGAMTNKRQEPVIEPERGDKRFKDEIWTDNPFYDYMKQSYLLTGKWLQDRLADADELSEHDRKKLDLLVRNYVAAMAPTNIPALNPEVLETTIEEGGDNLMRGLENLMRDLDRGDGTLMIRQTDMDAFQVGENIAVTPGKVVFRNELFELLQYAPQTETVYETPLLIIPPWINKFYILDLSEEKSLIRWLTQQGYTVFIISWVNPTGKHKDETWESYMKKGVLTALDKVLEETGSKTANVVGYCIGGTMLGTTLAYMAEGDGNKRINSATFFTAQLDFSDAGELQAFIDDAVIDMIEGQVQEAGYLEAKNMFNAFNSLRSSDLIWSFVVNNYLLGKDNFPFDLLYWNSDSTAMPAKLHVFYLDQFYNKNMLAKGKMEIAGRKLDLSKVNLPCFHVAARNDHIAPSPSAYRAAKVLGGEDHRFVLSGSGHIAGIVNPPQAEKYQYWTKEGIEESSLAEWEEGLSENAGSWWPFWHEWLKQRSGEQVEAREPGATLGAIEDAPGSYVKVRADARDM